MRSILILAVMTACATPNPVTGGRAINPYVDIAQADGTAEDTTVIRLGAQWVWYQPASVVQVGGAPPATFLAPVPAAPVPAPEPDPPVPLVCEICSAYYLDPNKHATSHHDIKLGTPTPGLELPIRVATPEHGEDEGFHLDFDGTHISTKGETAKTVLVWAGWALVFLLGGDKIRTRRKKKRDADDIQE